MTRADKVMLFCSLGCLWIHLADGDAAAYLMGLVQFVYATTFVIERISLWLIERNSQ